MLVASELECPNGHQGPWRYVESIEVWRDVASQSGDSITVDSEWHTGEGYNDGVPGTSYLQCWAVDGEGHCAERVELPAVMEIVWD